MSLVRVQPGEPNLIGTWVTGSARGRPPVLVTGWGTRKVRQATRGVKRGAMAARPLTCQFPGAVCDSSLSPSLSPSDAWLGFSIAPQSFQVLAFRPQLLAADLGIPNAVEIILLTLIELPDGTVLGGF